MLTLINSEKNYEFRRTSRKFQKVLISKGGCCRHVSLKIKTSMNDLTFHMHVWFKRIYFILEYTIQFSFQSHKL